MTESAGPGHRHAGRVALALFCAGILLGGCSAPGTGPAARASGGFDLRQLAKTDINRVAETHQQHVFASLRRLADKYLAEGGWPIVMRAYNGGPGNRANPANHYPDRILEHIPGGVWPD